MYCRRLRAVSTTLDTSSSPLLLARSSRQYWRPTYTTIYTTNSSNCSGSSIIWFEQRVNVLSSLHNNDYYYNARNCHHGTITLRTYSTTNKTPKNKAVDAKKNEIKRQKEILEQEKNPAIDNVVSESMSPLMNAIPKSLRPYAQLARIDKPIGTMLLLWPCLWSTSIASTVTAKEAPSSYITLITEQPSLLTGDPTLLVLFATGAFLMRGAGCTINDMWDAKYDKKVTRTQSRPLASGELTHTQATAFLGLQLTGGLGVLLSLPHLEYCFLLGASSLPLVALYPTMKRFTNWPQLVLGMAFNWGAFMGWAATHGSLDAFHGWSVVLPFYAGGVAWTLVYDTLYAHQDKRDDAKLGLKSTALHFGEATKPVLFGFSSLATGMWMLAGYNNIGYIAVDTIVYPYYVGCGLAGAHLLWQVQTADLNDEKNLAERFKSNNTVGGIIFASCVAGNLVAISS